METKPSTGLCVENTLFKILLVEDNPIDFCLFREMLRGVTTATFEVTQAERLADALDRLAIQSYDVVLADLTLPDSHGLETFQRIQAQAPALAIIVLSGAEEENVALSAVRGGAQDYLVKSRVDAYQLGRAVLFAAERNRAIQALAESERHHKHLLESITDYSYSVAVENGQAISASHGPGCLALTGYAPAEFQADPNLWKRLVPEEDRPGVAQQTNAVLTGTSPPPLEHRIVHKNGQVRWVRSLAVPRRDKQGRVVAYDGLISNITEGKRAEEKLVSSEAFYHSLVENLPQNIFRKDLRERFSFANQRFCAMLGHPLEDIIGKTDFDFYPPELAAKYQADDRTVIRTGRIFETVEENIAPNGEKIYVCVVKVPIYDTKGKILGTQCIFWDITEQKRFEERLQKANLELAASEQALRRSNEELKSAQLQLIQAEKMESIGTLAAGVAHEVKNPLAIMLMGVNYLAKKIPPNDENLTMVLGEMREAIERANTITRGLLDFSASRQLAVTAADLNQILDETLKLVRHELSQRKIHLVKQKAEHLPAVAVDKTQIQQVFVNVFLNAIHAMPEGGTLTVRTSVRSLTETTHFEGSRRADHFWVGDTAVVAEVEDTGSGIREENLAKIFDPFFTTKPTGVGTGLGLPVSKKIIELHGGTIDIKNKTGGGGVRVTIMLKQLK